nr:ubiquitin-conjugating enzyme E2 Z-like [Dermacentor andersoni]
MLPTKVVSVWDPLKHLEEQPTPVCLQRLKRDIFDFVTNRPPRIFIAPEESDITRINVLMLGAPGSPYEGGAFQFLVKCPPDYPVSPPRVRFLTTDEGRVRFHPHLCTIGMVCLSALGTGNAGPGWNPAQSLSSTLVSIQQLLVERPLYEFMREARVGDAANYDIFIQHEVIRVAVCDQVDAALREDPQCPPTFRKVILESFLELSGKHENAVKARLHQTGRQLWDPLGYKYTTAQYDTLLLRLRSLKEKVQERKAAETAAAACVASAAAVYQ